MWPRLTAVATLVAATMASTATLAQQVKTRSAPLPPYAGAYQPQGVDERGQWMLADEAERKMRDSKLLVADPELNAYVRGVLCRTVGADRCGGVRIYIARVPLFNAFMMDNGTMQVWSGFLLRVRSEAELAAVLGHEFGHFEQRHGLARFQQRRTATDIMTWAGFMGGEAGRTVHDVALTSIFSFTRAQEKEADLKSFAYLAASPYRPGASADIWERLMDEADATAAGRKQRSSRYRLPFFETHPTELQRAKYLRELAKKDGDEGEDGAERYAKAMAKWRPEFLADQIKLNDFGGTEYLLGELARSGWTSDLLYARAELYRMRGHPRDLVAAADFYRAAIDKGSVSPETRRGLGLALMRSGSVAEGQRALRDYLAMKPDAADRELIAALLEPAGSN